MALSRCDETREPRIKTKGPHTGRCTFEDYGSSSSPMRNMHVTKSEDNMASILRDDPTMSGAWNTPFAVPNDAFNINNVNGGVKERNQEIAAVPLMIHEEEMKDEVQIQTQNNTHAIPNGSESKSQPLFVGSEGITSDNSDADHSDHPAFQSPMQMNDAGIRASDLRTRCIACYLETERKETESRVGEKRYSNGEYIDISHWMRGGSTCLCCIRKLRCVMSVIN
eukprot:66653_1